MNLITQLRNVFPAARLLNLSLFSIPLVDEIVSTVPVLALPLMRVELDLDYVQMGWLFSIAGVAAWLVEPGVNAVSDHWPKRHLILFSMLGLALGMALAGSSPSFALLLLAFVLIGATNGTALAMCQAILIDQRPQGSLRTMTRWTLMATLGDLAGPVLIATVFAVGMGWRWLFWASASIWLVAFIVLALQRLPTTASATSDDGEPFSWQMVRDSLLLGMRTPHLLRWLLLTLLPGLLDEMFLAFATLFLLDRLGMVPAAISLALAIHVTGGLLGLLLLDRFGGRFQPQRLLGWLAWVVLVGLLLFVFAPAPWSAILALWLVGVGVSSWYPIAKAAAYRTLPGRSGTVRAIYALGTPVEVIAPLLIGVAAQRWGIQTGVALLMLVPIAVLLLRPKPLQPAT